MELTFNYYTAYSAAAIAGIASYRASSAILASLSAASEDSLAIISFSAAIADSYPTTLDSLYTFSIKASVLCFFSAT